MKNDEIHKLEQIASALHGEINDQEFDPVKLASEHQEFADAKKIFGVKD